MAEKQPMAVGALNAIRSSASPAYQSAVPAATPYNLGAVGAAITEGDWMNEFLNTLYNRIGIEIIRRNMFTDPFQALNKGMLTRGKFVYDIFSGIVSGDTYAGVPADGQSLDPFIVKRNIPQTDIIQMDIKRVYQVTTTEENVRQAFIDLDKMDEFIRVQIDGMFVGMQKERWDAAKAKMSLKTLYPNASQLVDYTKDSAGTVIADAKARLENFMLTLKQAKTSLQYWSNTYNRGGVDTLTPEDRLWLIIDAKLRDAVDVGFLSGLFHLEKGQTVFDRVIPVDDFEAPTWLNLPANSQVSGLKAIIVDSRGAIFHDYLDGVFEAIRNPRGLYWNNYLHWWGMRDYSKFANIIGIYDGTVTPAA